jgi:Membrane transporters of cations and cationic drugs
VSSLSQGVKLHLQKSRIKKLLPYIALNVIVFLYSLGGICSKLAASKEFFSFEWIMLYGLLLLSLAIYAVTWQQILKKIPLNTAYTLKSVGVIWTMIWGAVVFHEQITWINFVSAAFIIVGVVFMTTSDKKTEKGEEDNE